MFAVYRAFLWWQFFSVYFPPTRDPPSPWPIADPSRSSRSIPLLSSFLNCTDYFHRMIKPLIVFAHQTREEENNVDGCPDVAESVEFSCENHTERCLVAYWTRPSMGLNLIEARLWIHQILLIGLSFPFSLLGFMIFSVLPFAEYRILSCKYRLCE